MISGVRFLVEPHITICREACSRIFLVLCNRFFIILFTSKDVLTARRETLFTYILKHSSPEASGRFFKDYDGFLVLFRDILG